MKSSVKVKIFNSLKAWHHEREDLVPLNNDGDLDLRELESFLGYTGQCVCQVSAAALHMHRSASSPKVFNPRNHRVVVEYRSGILKGYDLDYLTHDSEFLCLLKVAVITK